MDYSSEIQKIIALITEDFNQYLLKNDSLYWYLKNPYKDQFEV